MSMGALRPYLESMDMGRAENIAISPTIEKYAATADTANAENNVIMINDKLLCLTISLLQNSSKELELDRSLWVSIR